ncbi:MAG: hypothetical protein Greene041619_1095 [Candidatus Peregrinibacteria bacterium Greene0416_19]|nr:MAG: hypothetical protein Greene041619_1095 [Candidatus Peregrinibacteria bacterium Greene0416_19]
MRTSPLLALAASCGLTIAGIEHGQEKKVGTPTSPQGAMKIEWIKPERDHCMGDAIITVEGIRPSTRGTMDVSLLGNKYRAELSKIIMTADPKTRMPLFRLFLTTSNDAGGGSLPIPLTSIRQLGVTFAPEPLTREQLQDLAKMPKRKENPVAKDVRVSLMLRAPDRNAICADRLTTILRGIEGDLREILLSRSVQLPPSVRVAVGNAKKKSIAHSFPCDLDAVETVTIEVLKGTIGKFKAG